VNEGKGEGDQNEQNVPKVNEGGVKGKKYLAWLVVAWWSVSRVVQGKEEETEKDKTEWSPG
jgi:hypothetical protein